MADCHIHEFPADPSYLHDLVYTGGEGEVEPVLKYPYFETALQDAGLVFDSLAEHDSAPWDAVLGLMTEGTHGEYRLTEKPERLAATYTLQAHRTTERGAVAPSGTPA